VNDVPVAIIGAGPYGLSIAAHLAARKIEHRILGVPMQFWSKIAAAGSARYLKSYCFGTNISTPEQGFSFADFSRPRGLETFEPCSIDDFAQYGQWFQQSNVSWVEPVDVARVDRDSRGFALTLANGERFTALRLVVATGLAGFAHVPAVLATLSRGAAMHTSEVVAFSSFKGRSVAVIGGGQSALEAAALLHEAGARPQLLIRESSVRWHTRVPLQRSLWRRLRSPITGLGSGPKAWLLTRFPDVIHRLPSAWRSRIVASHLPAEGAWWLRPRVEKLVPVEFDTTVVSAEERADGLVLRLRRSDNATQREIRVDHVIAGSGYVVDVDRLGFLDARLRGAIGRIAGSPNLDSGFQASVPGLHFVGPASAMSFGPLFRFVVGAEYTARIVAAQLSSQLARAAA
jgi:thioredoxin reductase